MCARHHKPIPTDILEAALDALRRETGLTAEIQRLQPARITPTGYRPDALIAIEVNDRRHEFAAEIKNIYHYETAAQVRAFFPQHAHPPLILVAPYIAAKIAEKCRELRLFFLDAAGNAYIDVPGFFVHIAGKRRPPQNTIAERGRVNKAAGLKVIFAILCRPDLLTTNYREIATAAQVALGTIGPVLNELEGRRHIATFGTPVPRRRLVDAERLVKEWVDFYAAILRPKLRLRRFRGPEKWTQHLEIRRYGAYWGGEMAAKLMTGYLRPETMVIYTRHDPLRLVAENRLRADVNGDVEILDVFWNPEKIPHPANLVPPLLVYADLVITTEGRNLDAARLIYEEHVAPNLLSKS